MLRYFLRRLDDIRPYLIVLSGSQLMWTPLTRAVWKNNAIIEVAKRQASVKPVKETSITSYPGYVKIYAQKSPIFFLFCKHNT